MKKEIFAYFTNSKKSVILKAEREIEIEKEKKIQKNRKKNRNTEKRKKVFFIYK